MKELFKKFLQFLFPVLIYSIKTNKKQLVLTFDDGPNQQYTPQILDVLKKHEIPAVFFVVGENVEKHPGIVQRLFEEGHEIGNHSQAHRQYAGLSFAEKKEEILSCNQTIAEVSSHSCLFFRPPQGTTDFKLLSFLAKQNMFQIMWNFDSNDWNFEHVDDLKVRLNAYSPEKGDILLFHDDYQTTVEALDDFIVAVKQKGFEFVSLSSLMYNKSKL